MRLREFCVPLIRLIIQRPRRDVRETFSLSVVQRRCTTEAAARHVATMRHISCRVL